MEGLCILRPSRLRAGDGAGQEEDGAWPVRGRGEMKRSKGSLVRGKEWNSACLALNKALFSKLILLLYKMKRLEEDDLEYSIDLKNQKHRGVKYWGTF